MLFLYLVIVLFKGAQHLSAGKKIGDCHSFSCQVFASCRASFLHLTASVLEACFCHHCSNFE